MNSPPAFGPALCGLGTIAACGSLGEGRRSNLCRTGWAVMTASTLGLIVFSHTARASTCPDIHDNVLRSLAFGRFDKLQEGRCILPLVSFYFFIGLALLAKGLVGVFSICDRGALSTSSPVECRRGRILLSIVWGLPLFCDRSYVVSCRCIRHGREFVEISSSSITFERFTSNKYHHPQPFYFFSWVLPLMTLPWAALASLLPAMR